MGAPGIVVELIERFERQRDAYRSGDYNEARLRREFIDPFFSALGWDMDNRRGYAEAYKDVIHEDSIKVSGGTKAPDYCFRIGATRKFFVEAKKPAVNIKDDISPAYQLRRYAWSAKLPLSILTDFEEFAVYDCRVRPQIHDKASVARLTYVTCDEYLERWDEISERFARESVLRGAFDKFADTSKGKRGTTEVDDAFLEEIESWREILASNIALRNPRISQSDLGFVVQRTIDRIIFLRICEDRGIENYGQLQSICQDPNLYRRLLDRFHRADERYNSGLFHFRSEADRAEAPDQLTTDISIDDKPLRGILESLYYPSSPYEFSIFSADILGHVYERFLGKVIRLTTGHRAKVEEKPEVRKAGGVYYTPDHIVTYVVERTLGKLLKGKTSDEALALRVLDPACGTGSFLLGAYQHLLDWHLQWFLENDPEKHAARKLPPIFWSRHSEWRLTARKRKEILVSSIFGVDLDSQAIEVTKLSLLLKVLEGETEESINAALKLFHDRALPDLGKNVRHGNSLIGPDLWSKGQMRLALDGDDPYMPFDWVKAFQKVFRDGGFDVVIGNPPYLSFAGRQSVEIPDWLREYYANAYESGGWPTAHTLFLERAIKLLTKRYASFIVPDQVGHLSGYQSVRDIAVRECGLVEVRYWGEHVFRGVTTPALTAVLDKEHKGSSTVIFDKDGGERGGQISVGQTWSFSPSVALIQRLRQRSFSLGKLVGDCGIRTTAAKEQVFPLEAVTGRHVPTLEGKQVQRYVCAPPEVAVRTDTKTALCFGNEERRREAKFVIRQTAAYPIVGPREHVVNFRNSLLALFAPPEGDVDVRYIVGLLNSRLLRFIYTETVRESQQRTFPQVKVAALQSLPLREIDFSNVAEKRTHDGIVKLVTEALETQRRVAMEKNPVRKEALARHFEMVDAEIDKAVFALYGMSVDEISVVNAATWSAGDTEPPKPKSWRPAGANPVGGPKRAKPAADTQKARKRA